MSKLVAELSPNQTKTQLAGQLGISRSDLYYTPKLPKKDIELASSIEQVLVQHPSYGHRRVALELSINKKRVRRVMRLFGIRPKRMRRIPAKPKDCGQEAAAIPNRLLGLVIDHPNHVWVSDFTYLPYFGKFMYLATVVDAFTREVVGWSIGSKHNADLVMAALNDALNKHGKPEIFHSDQGSEYRSDAFQKLLATHSIQLSMSAKGSPWQNGKQESFYSQFKLELGHPEIFPTVGELVEGIAAQIYYYDHKRIHSALKCPPTVFAKRFEMSESNSAKLVRESV